jgi:putative inorganic carbon (hco3(-)) transporter
MDRKRSSAFADAVDRRRSAFGRAHSVRFADALPWLPTCCGGLVFGVLLGALAGATRPIVVLALPAIILLTAAIFTRPSVGIMAVYASIPIGFAEVQTYPLSVKVVELVMFFAAAIIGTKRLTVGLTPFSWAPQMKWALALVAWTVVATPSSLDITLALKQVVLLAGGVVLALTVLTACRSVADVRSVVRVLLVVGGAMAAYGLKNVPQMRAAYLGAAVQGRADSVFADPNHFGGFAAILLMVSIGMMLGAKKRSDTVLGAVCASVSLLGLLMSLSRGAWLGAVLAGGIMLYLVPQARRALLVVGVPVLVAATLIGAFRPSNPEVVVLRERLGTFSSLLGPTRYRYDERPAIWAEALREIGLDPWTGQGPGNFPVASARAASLASTVGAAHAHNVLLTVSAEAGLPAAGLLIIFTVAIGFAVWRVAQRSSTPEDRALLAGIGCGLVIQLGQGAVDFNFRNAVISMIMWSLVGLVLVGDRLLASGRLGTEAEAPDPVVISGEMV